MELSWAHSEDIQEQNLITNFARKSWRKKTDWKAEK